MNSFDASDIWTDSKDPDMSYIRNSMLEHYEHHSGISRIDFIKSYVEHINLSRSYEITESDIIFINEAENIVDALYIVQDAQWQIGVMADLNIDSEPDDYVEHDSDREYSYSSELQFSEEEESEDSEKIE
jgi:hypothetical protein